MIVGDPNRFAIESGITKAFERLSFRALGYFVIYVRGRRYGAYSPEATLLACSFDEVRARIAGRGRHIVPFASEADAGRIADAYRHAIYAPNQESAVYFGISQPEFHSLISAKKIDWAPDGDEAFDDGSFVLHFDVGTRVRLIAFRSVEHGYHHDPATLRDLWLEAEDFYRVLQQWSDMFETAWKASPKISNAEDGAERKSQ